MPKNVKIGEEEMKALAYVAERPGSSAAEVAKAFATIGLARTTVQTVLERLRKKGLLERIEQDGAYRYSSVYPIETLRQGLLKQFIGGMLGASSNPLLSYLDGSAKLDSEDIALLRELVDQLEANK